MLLDLRYTVRTLGRSPAFTAAAVLTLTLGIGATVAVFTVVNGVLLRPMPFPDPDRLFLLTLTQPGPIFAQPGMSDANYLAFRANDRAFEHVAAFSNNRGNLTRAGDPAVINVGDVTADFFNALGVQPVAGRTFLPDDGEQGREPIVVLSDRLWKNRFAADPAIVGKDLTLDGVRRVGTYGVLAYSVAQRTHEIGLRRALGARDATVLWMVMCRTLVLSATGVAIGIAGAWFATRLLTAFLFETTPTDPMTFTVVALAIFVAALAAGMIPARRATRVDPLVALRHE